MQYSVIIPTFNRRHLIGKAIQSVLNQTVSDFEIIVVDDGSTDGTAEWLSAQYPSAPIRILQNNRAKGPAGARNMGILEAKGDIIAFLDSDDEFYPHHLLECAQLLANLVDVDVVFGRAHYFSEGKRVDYMSSNFEMKLAKAIAVSNTEHWRVFSDRFFEHLLQNGCYFNLCTVALRKVAALELMDESLRVAEDYEYWVRLSRSHQFACLLNPQVMTNLHDGNISFEGATSSAQHAPSQIHAFRQILVYPGLRWRHRQTIHQQIGQIYFDWGYRCRTHLQFSRATSRHLLGMREGFRLANLRALLKLPVVALMTKLRRVTCSK